MECFIRLAWDWLYSPDPIHIKWRLKNYKALMAMLKTSPFDWLIYDVSFIQSISHPSIIYNPPTKFCVIWSVHLGCLVHVPLYYNCAELVLCDRIGRSFLKWFGKLPNVTLPRRRASN